MNYHQQVLVRIDECLDPNNFATIVKHAMTHAPKLVLEALNTVDPRTDEGRQLCDTLLKQFDILVDPSDYPKIEEACVYARIDRKIQSIKIVREIVNLGLKETKHCVDSVFPPAANR
jgi:hypothetical protein